MSSRVQTIAVLAAAAVVAAVIGAWALVVEPQRNQQAIAQAVASAPPSAVASATPTGDGRPTLQQAEAKLHSGAPFTLAVISDSTGFGPNAWVRRTALAIAAKTGRVAEFHEWDPNAGAYKAPERIGSGSGVLTVWNGSAPGRNAGYAYDNLGTILPPNADLIIVNHGHNGGAVYNATEQLKRLLGGIYGNTDNDKSAVVITAQNPLYHRENVDLDAQIVAATRDVAATWELPVLDAYKAFQQAGNLPSLLSSDGLHPSSAGYEVWSAAALKFLGF